MTTDNDKRKFRITRNFKDLATDKVHKRILWKRKQIAGLEGEIEDLIRELTHR